MRNTSLPIVLIAGFAISSPAYAQADFGKIVSGIAQSLLTQEADRAAYEAAQHQNTAAAYRNYLDKFPSGAFRTPAEKSLAGFGVGAGGTVKPNPPTSGTSTGNGVQTAASIEASVGLTRSQRVTIQKQLSSLGYSTGGADGLWGANTRKAIGQWQGANKLSATGYVTASQVDLIARQAGAAGAVGASGTIAADDPVEERLLSLTSEERREVQRRLTSLGYNTRGVDGAFGANTRRALAEWQGDQGLRESGYLTADQLRTLRRESGG
jgi:peptidoglycan hydrolase-like protein with peptidoglycan-binding domain